MRKFLTPKVFVPIHCFPKNNKNSLDYVLDNAILLEENGVDGVFLVSEDASLDEMLYYYEELKYLKINCFEIGFDFLLIDPIYNNEKIIEIIESKRFDLVRVNQNLIEEVDKNIFSDSIIISSKNFNLPNSEDLENKELEDNKRKMYFYSDVLSISPTSIKEIKAKKSNSRRLTIFSNNMDMNNIHDYLECGVTDFVIEDYFVNYLNENNFIVFDFELIRKTVKSVKDFK